MVSGGFGNERKGSLQRCKKTSNPVTCKIKNSNMISGYVNIGRFWIFFFASMKTNGLIKQCSVPYLEVIIDAFLP